MDLLQRLLYTALSAFSLFYVVVRISLSHWKNRGILHEKPKFLWGNLKGVGTKRHIATAIQDIYEKYKGQAPFIGFYTYLKPMVLILDINTIEQMLSKDAGYFLERGLYSNVSNDPLSCNLMQLDGAKWQAMRDKLHNIFAAEKMEALLPALQRISGTFQRSFEAKQRVQGVFKINELVECFNIDVVSTLAFGLEGDSLLYSNTEFRQMTQNYMKNFSLLKAYLAFDYPNLARLLQYKSYDEVATKYFLNLVNDKIKERDWNRPTEQQQQAHDFLKMFAEPQSIDNFKTEYLSSKEIAAQAFSFILAGLEACNSTITFCLYELALQPQIQEKAHAEIVSTLQRHSNKLDLKAVNEMHYLKQILYETLRKYSPYPFLLRNTIKDYEVPNSIFMLKSGNYCIIPIHAIHHDPQIYAEPQKFDPARFEPAARKLPFLPFGAGPRACIAQKFAELQMFMCLITLLRHCKFSPCSETVERAELKYDNTKLLLNPKSEIKLCIERI